MPVEIGPYRVEGELRTVGNGQVAVAQSTVDGKRYFLKVFDRYVMPTEEALATGHPAALRRRSRFEAYQARMEEINRLLRGACGKTAGLVTAVEFFRDGHKLVKVNELVDFDDRPAAELHEAYGREELLRVFRSALVSVQTLHGQGIVHGDLKPENIFVCREDVEEGDGAGVPVGRVSDFDDSFFADEVPDACDVTSTVEYYSPELARYVSHAEDGDPLGKAGSEPALAVGRAHDVFALGLVLHVYLTGALPQARGGGYVHEALLRYGDAGVRLDEGLDPLCAALVRWMIRRDPAARPRTCAEVLNALNAGGRGVPTVRLAVRADDAGVPLEGMRALLELHGSPVARCRGDRDGAALLAGYDVSPDRYTVAVRGRGADGGRLAAARDVPCRPSDGAEVPVFFHFAGGELRAVDGNPPVPAAGEGAGGGVALGVEVVRAGGAPLAGCEVRLRSRGGLSARGTTDGRGRAVFRGVPREPVRLSVRGAGGAARAGARTVALDLLPEGRARAAVRVELASPAEPDVVFEPPRDGRYVSLTAVGGGRVLIGLADGTVMRKPLRELGLYGMREYIEGLAARG